MDPFLRLLELIRDVEESRAELGFDVSDPQEVRSHGDAHAADLLSWTPPLRVRLNLSVRAGWETS